MRSIDIYTERERECKAFLSSRAFQKSFSCSEEWREVYNFLSFLLVCLSESEKAKLSVVFVRSRVFSERFLSERLVFWTPREAKKASEREREKEREGESAPQERQTQTQKDGERRRKTESRILGREDDIVRDDDDSDDERISSSPPGKISREEEEEMEQKERANDGGARHGRENPVRGEKHVHHPARRKRCETGGN